MKLTRLLLWASLFFAGSAQAAITYESSATVGCDSCAASSVSDAITYPGGIDAGDLILVAIAAEGGDASTHTWTTPTGYTLIREISDATGSDRLMAVYYKKAAGTESGTLDINRDGGDNHEHVAVMSVWNGVDATTQLDISITASHESLSQNDPLSPDPAAITTVTDNALVVTILNSTSNDITAFGAPSGYTLRGSELSTINEMAFSEKLVVTAGAEDPGVWTNSGTAVDADQAMLTIALRPSTSGSTTTWTDDTVDVGTTIQGTLDVAFSGNITKCVFASTDELTASSATTSAADCAQTKADFLSGGDLSNTRIAVAENASLENVTETSTADLFTFNNPDNGTTEHFGTAACTPGSDCDTDSLFEDAGWPAAFTLGDDVWLTVTEGACDFEPTTGVMECSALPAAAEYRWYDVTATDWSVEGSVNVEVSGIIDEGGHLRPTTNRVIRGNMRGVVGTP